MGTILLAWELGGGLGHVTQLASLVNGLRPAGHRIIVALRELPRAVGVLDDCGVTLLQSPYKPPETQSSVATPRTFAHVLWNAGFGSFAELQARTEAWGSLLDSVKPNLIVFDHAPTALLAARGPQVKRVVIGNGFCCPPDCSPLPDLRVWMPPEPEQLQEAEEHVLDCMNQVLERRHAEPLERITQLYGQVDDTFLTTLAEFDHYQKRQALTPSPSPGGRGERFALTPLLQNPKGADRETALTPCPSPASGRGEQSAITPLLENPKSECRNRETALTPCPSPASGRGEIFYRGPWPLSGGEAPMWPAGSGKRIYAYLSAFPAREHLLGRLIELGDPVIVSVSATDIDSLRRFAAPNLRFEQRPLDLKQVARDCDLAILNGNHGTTIAMLLAGKPTLQIPIFLEQAINAIAAKRLGAGLIASSSSPQEILEKLAAMLGSDHYADAARRFAAKYADFDARVQIRAALDRLEELLT